ncbi:hypothetical protein H8356DRAFT_1341021 [Neocallimastix lanati (nom. inval.)]|nr:hypothetical protein H8356DRAFT_1341021 [Neocallimastix sp. JGI-2020a]
MITCSIIANVICVIWDNGLLEKEGEHFGFIDYSGIEVVHPKLIYVTVKHMNIKLQEIMAKFILKNLDFNN